MCYRCEFVSFTPTQLVSNIDPNQVSVSAKLNLDSGPFKTSFIPIVAEGPFHNKTTALQITFMRKTLPHVVTSIIPAIMVVTIGMGQFWVDTHAARAAIGIITFLTLNNLKSSVSRELPQTGSLAWLEVCLLMNIGFLWFSLLTTVVAWLPITRCNKPRKATTDKKDANTQEQVLSIPYLQEGVVQTLFNRYDLNENGFIDSYEEIQQLTLNLVTTLNLSLSSADLDLMLRGAENVADAPFDLKGFSEWFEAATRSTLIKKFDVDEEWQSQELATNVRCRPSNINGNEYYKAGPGIALTEVTQEESRSEKPQLPKEDLEDVKSLAKAMLIRVLFPIDAPNYADRFARFWVPTIYALMLIISFVEIA